MPAQALQSADTGVLGRWARRAPVAVFLAGTFVWAWALWGYWIPAMPPGGLVITPGFIACAIAGGFAPSLAAIVVTWLAGGRASVGRLLAGLTRWQAPAGHYLLALGVVPIVTGVAVGLQSLVIGPVKPPEPSIIALAVIWPLMAAFGEEIGWRGFLYPRLLDRYGSIGAALALGVIWGVWHLPADYIGLKAYEGLFWAAFLLNGPVILTAHALIMAWLWQRSDGNLLLMVLYHFTITASSMLAPTAGGQDASGLAAAAVSAGLFWVVATLLWAGGDRRPG